MASQHARSVQLNRKEYGDEINYNLALCIALHMGSDGKPARLAISTLAEHGFCHYNTADKRLKEMAAMGLIKMSKAGKLFDYSIPGEHEDEEAESYQPPAVDHSDEIERINGRLDNLERQVVNLVKMVETLSHELHTIFTSSSHELHMNFTPAVNENVNKEEKKRRREGDNNPPNPPAGKKREKPQENANNLRFCPEYLATPDFLNAWGEWEQYHDDKGRPLAPGTAKKQLQDMSKWGADRAVNAIDYSIRQGYIGLVEPNNNSPGRNGHTPSGETVEDILSNLEVADGFAGFS